MRGDALRPARDAAALQTESLSKQSHIIPLVVEISCWCCSFRRWWHFCRTRYYSWISEREQMEKLRRSPSLPLGSCLKGSSCRENRGTQIGRVVCRQRLFAATTEITVYPHDCSVSPSSNMKEERRIYERHLGTMWPRVARPT